MPTCSQAKIITNLELDIHKRLFKLSNTNTVDNLNENDVDIDTKISILATYSKLNSSNLPRANNIRKVRSVNDYSNLNQINDYSQKQQQKQSLNDTRNPRLKSRRVSVDDFTTKLPSIYGEQFTLKKDSVPVNFLYNSPYRTSGRNFLTSNQIKINALRSELHIKNTCSDGEDYEENTSSCSDANNSDKSMVSYQDKSDNSHRNSLSINNNKNSLNLNNFLPIRSKRNSLEEGCKLDKEILRRSAQFSYFPKLALEVETISNDINHQDCNENEYEKKMSIDQAKRLLALASIRPSKTFHKTMTAEEIEVLKKYYEIIKPKANNHNSQNQTDLEKYKIETVTPIVYNSSKVNQHSLENVKNFIDSYKKEIDSGLLIIEYDQINDPKGFVLKNRVNESIIRFPDEINDTFLALAMSSCEKDSQPLLGEANLFRIVNWNDTKIVANSFKSTKSAKIKDVTNESSKSSSATSSSVSFEYIKSLSGLVNSILDPKLLKQLSYSGVDTSVLPGGVNFEMPTFEELGINLNTILAQNEHTLNSEFTNLNQNQTQIQTAKLKNTAYKKLKDKVAKSKVMWFASPPERKPLSVIFEHAGVDMEHETLLDEANKYLKQIGGHVESLEFVPRSVRLNSVYVENLWILTLNDMNTKFFTITNGLKIKDETILVKSYDEFIFSEYENYIRNEKYKQLIKNHEKAVQNTNKKSSKK